MSVADQRIHHARHSVRPLAQPKGTSSAKAQTSTKRRTLPVKQDLHLAPDCNEKKYYFCTVEQACMNHDRTYRPVPYAPALRLRDADGSMRQAPRRSAGYAATHPVPPLKGLPGTRATDVSYRALAPGGAGICYRICTGTSESRPTANYSLLTANSTYTFSAKEKDTETGLSYFGSRYYSSDLSVWLSVDPMAGKYPSLSPYTYCADNPVKLVDPNGEEFVDGDGNRVRVRVLKDGTIQYKFSRKTSDATKSEFISNHNESLSALAKTKSGRKCIRFLNNCYTSVSISPTEESGKQNSLVIPSSDENGNVEINDGVYENVVIKPFMGTIRNKASRDNVDVDEILGATLIVEAGHLKKSQISKDYNDNLTEESKYYQLYNQYVDYRYNYRKEMGQPVDETVFNNSANINPRLNRINSKRKKQYGQN